MGLQSQPALQLGLGPSPASPSLWPHPEKHPALASVTSGCLALSLALSSTRPHPPAHHCRRLFPPTHDSASALVTCPHSPDSSCVLTFSPQTCLVSVGVLREWLLLEPVGSVCAVFVKLGTGWACGSVLACHLPVT